jgi:hypothetical protein
MNMKKILFLLLAGLIISPAFSQAVLIEENEPDRVYNETKWGPNRQHFGYWYWNYGFAIPTETKYDVKIAASGQHTLGYAYKIKALKFMDVGLKLAYSNKFYNLNENTIELFDTTRNWDKIRTFQNGIQSEMFLRFYLKGKRGNYFGPHIDLGFYADYHLKSGWYKRYKDDDIAINQTEYRNGDFNQLSYGPTFAFGVNSISAFAQYNLNSVLTNDVNLNPMPSLIFGVNFNLFAVN